MIICKLSKVIRDVTVEIEGEANTLSEIIDSWGAFQDLTKQIEDDISSVSREEISQIEVAS